MLSDNLRADGATMQSERSRNPHNAVEGSGTVCHHVWSINIITPFSLKINAPRAYIALNVLLEPSSDPIVISFSILVIPSHTLYVYGVLNRRRQPAGPEEQL